MDGLVAAAGAAAGAGVAAGAAVAAGTAGAAVVAVKSNRQANRWARKMLIMDE